MEAPCVRVPRERGEAVRRRLAEAGVLADALRITPEDGWLLVPITDAEADAVPEDLEVVRREVEPRSVQTMPGDLLEEEPSYERLGDIVLLDEEDHDRALAVAEAIMGSDLPVKTVVNRASKVKGRTRVREWDVLAGDGTETIHREYGFEYRLDIATVYFSPRLATERRRVTEQVGPGEQVFDMFAGVGPFVIPAAARGATAVGVDVNEAAVTYLRENAERNGVEERITAIHGDVRDVAADYRGWADRLLMNLPHRADEFLDVAMTLAGRRCVVHYYDMQPEDDPFGPGERAIRASAGDRYEVEVLEAREVRSYSPGVSNVCLDVELVALE